MISVNQFFQRLVAIRYQYCDLSDAWVDFLRFLERRRGVDLRTVRGLEEIQLAWNSFDNGGVELLDSAADDCRTEWFRAFNCRPDVLDALRKFCADRGIPHHKLLDEISV